MDSGTASRFVRTVTVVELNPRQIRKGNCERASTLVGIVEKVAEEHDCDCSEEADRFLDEFNK
jgi:hypothetical protein